MKLITAIKQLRLECIRASKRAHDVYRAVRTPLHGLYFCAAIAEAHTLVFALVTTGLLAMLIIGAVIEEKLL